MKVYQGVGQVGEETTKEDGSFSTIGIELEEDQDVTFETGKQDYMKAYKRRSSNTSTEEVINLSIALISEVPIIPPPLGNPADLNLISHSGNVLNPDDSPSSATGLLAYNIVQQNSSTWCLEGGLFTTDENGYYEILAPLNTQFNYIIWEEDCSLKITENDEIIFGDVQSQVLVDFQKTLNSPH